MNCYSLRKNYFTVFSDKEKKVRAKIAFKTKETLWVDTEAPVLILISIHSAFNEYLKLEALISTIKNSVKGPVTVLLADRAHVRTRSLIQTNALEKSIRDAEIINHRFKALFEGCSLTHWHSYIFQDESFTSCLNTVWDLYRTDSKFRECLLADAEISYKNTFPNKKLFFEKMTEDLLEQCACILVLSKKGYRFQFYPGPPYLSTEYVNRLLLPKEVSVNWIKVFLAVEKKQLITK